jgi:two-component system, response regulator, stage 0 sporulation protein F
MSDVTLLYVDDEALNLVLFELNFKKKYKVITADSGHQGLIKLDQHSDIIVVVSDMKMPGMNGIEFVTEARKLYKHVIYFILTGFDLTPDIHDALKQGVIQKYFRKPMNIDEINNAIEHELAKLRD